MKKETIQLILRIGSIFANRPETLIPWTGYRVAPGLYVCNMPREDLSGAYVPIKHIWQVVSKHGLLLPCCKEFPLRKVAATAALYWTRTVGIDFDQDRDVVETNILAIPREKRLEIRAAIKEIGGLYD